MYSFSLCIFKLICITYYGQLWLPLIYIRTLKINKKKANTPIEKYIICEQEIHKGRNNNDKINVKNCTSLISREM